MRLLPNKRKKLHIFKLQKFKEGHGKVALGEKEGPIYGMRSSSLQT